MTLSVERRPGAAVTIAVTSGKGGVGKTSVVVNLAVALARLRHRVAVLDADFGLGNVDVHLGLMPPWHLGHVLTGARQVEEVIVDGPSGIRVVPSGSGLQELTALSPLQWERLSAARARVSAEVDFLLIDTPAGISSNVIDLLGSLEHVLLVTSMEPSAIVDAYAMMKVLSQANPGQDIGVLVNGVPDRGEAEMVFRQLDVAAECFLRRRPRYHGYVPFDPAVRDSLLLQRSTMEFDPECPASRCFRVLAARLARLAPGRRQPSLPLHLVAGRARAAGPMEAEPCA
jgi:flagellar biosynthesis protein FlhG